MWIRFSGTPTRWRTAATRDTGFTFSGAEARATWSFEVTLNRYASRLPQPTPSCAVSLMMSLAATSRETSFFRFVKRSKPGDRRDAPRLKEVCEEAYPDIANKNRHVFGVLAVCFFFAVVSAAPSLAGGVPPDGIDRPNPFRTGHTLVIPHGGGDGKYPEDTLYAYEHSMREGGEVVDLDVQQSADGVLVALHDATVNRTTNGTGQVAKMTFAEIQKLDAGWGFAKGSLHPFRNKGLRVPSLKEVLQRFPDKLVTLDLKDPDVKAVTAICALATDLKLIDRMYVGVDVAEQVIEFRRVCPMLRTSGTDAERQEARAAHNRGNQTFRSKQTVSQPSYLADDGTIRVTRETIESAHARNVAILTYVVDDPKAMKELVDLGVDGIYTRYPDVLARIVHDRKPQTAPPVR